MKSDRLAAALVLAAACLAACGAPPPAATPAVPGNLELVVRSTDVDVNGHVNNARYVEYAQWGRWEWLKAKGLTRARLREMGVVLVTVQVNVVYAKECNEDDVLVVTTELQKVGGKSFTLGQRVRKKSESAFAAEAVVTMVAIDPTSRKSRALPDEMVRALSAQ